MHQNFFPYSRASLCVSLIFFATACLAQNASQTELASASDSIARTTEEIKRRLEDQQQRPFRTFITTMTRSVGHAIYYREVRSRIEDVGTRDFPQKDGKKLYGKLWVSIPIYQDGSLFVRDGGIRVEKSSGNIDLDLAAIEIVKKAAPFSPFPRKMISAANDDLWVIETQMDFFREEVREETRKSGQK